MRAFGNLHADWAKKGGLYTCADGTGSALLIQIADAGATFLRLTPPIAPQNATVPSNPDSDAAAEGPSQQAALTGNDTELPTDQSGALPEEPAPAEPASDAAEVKSSGLGPAAALLQDSVPLQAAASAASSVVDAGSDEGEPTAAPDPLTAEAVPV